MLLWAKNCCVAETILCVGQNGHDRSVYKGILIVAGARLRPIGVLFLHEEDGAGTPQECFNAKKVWDHLTACSVKFQGFVKKGLAKNLAPTV